LGEFDLVGEIVDRKCYLGNMNPGNGKVHRDCAVRCLSGGILPVFATNDFNGSPAVLLLTGPNQKRLPREALLDRRATNPDSWKGHADRQYIASGDGIVCHCISQFAAST
jgi:hypothetical protein